jgi:SAM-dependent methyltransferase
VSTPADWDEANRRLWDDRVPIHVASQFYDVAGFKAGRPAIEPFEVDELGPLGGLRLAHLQCHFGMDTLDLVRLHPTLNAVGLDFSPAAIRAAASLAEELDLADRTSFVEANVVDAASVLGAGAFDVVYTGKGALTWLPDLHVWATQCWELLRPGGWLYVVEFHPIGDALSFDSPTVGDDYFRREPWVEQTVGSYADPSATSLDHVAYSFNHPLPELFGSLLDRGFLLRFFHEWDYTLFELSRWLSKGEDGRYRWPVGGGGRLPLMYSLKAFKPG